MMTEPLELALLGFRYLHTLGAIALFGGAIFARFALVPALKTLSPPDQDTLHNEVRRKWSRVVALAALFLLVSGIANLAIYGSRYEFPTFRAYNMIAGIKFLLALPILFIASLLTGRTKLARRMQEKGKFWMNVNLVLALIVVLIGGGLKFADRRPKANKFSAEMETRHSQLEGQAQAALRQATAVKEKLGEPLRFGDLPKKSLRAVDPVLEFKVTGPKGAGVAHLEVDSKGEEWKLTKLEVRCDDKTVLPVELGTAAKSDDPKNINLPEFDLPSDETEKK